MEQEEAIRILTICKDAVETEGFITAIDMAISALEREEADGCVGCLYEDLGGDEEPCNECKNNYTNEWKSKVSHEKQTEPSDLISRADAVKEIIRMTDNATDALYLVRALKALPSADAVSREEHEELYHKAEEVNRMANDVLADFPSYKELVSVVRCKDCRHGWYDDDIEYYTCRHPKGLNEELYGVDFCSYGEAKMKGGAE